MSESNVIYIFDYGMEILVQNENIHLKGILCNNFSATFASFDSLSVKSYKYIRTKFILRRNVIRRRLIKNVDRILRRYHDSTNCFRFLRMNGVAVENKNPIKSLII